jgi:hypothetical protein
MRCSIVEKHRLAYGPLGDSTGGRLAASRRTGYTLPVRPTLAVVCILYCISLVLLPAGLLHAHVGSGSHAHAHAHVQVHGGHDHKLPRADGEEHEHGGHVVEFNAAAEYVASKVFWIWIALPTVSLLLCLRVPRFVLSPRHQRREARKPQQFPPWPPPLRGPPISI